METPIILTGPAGCGKSTWIRKYAEEKGRQVFICPCRKDRTLREGRQRLHLWGRRTEPAILWLEGADDLTPEAQAFLRRILETHAPQVQFILECRNAGKLQEPIRSRCTIRRMSAPSWEEIAAYIEGFRGVSADEIKEYLMPYEYSWRRVQTCIHLALNSPEIWRQVLAVRRKEIEVRQGTGTVAITLQECIAEALDPYTLVMQKCNVDDYGECIERGGSLWALLGAGTGALDGRITI